jgi:hypothetical protein
LRESSLEGSARFGGFPSVVTLENCIASTSIFDVITHKLQKANGGCLGVYDR